MSKFSEEDFRDYAEKEYETASYARWALKQENAELKELLRWTVQEVWDRTHWNSDIRIDPRMTRITELLK